MSIKHAIVAAVAAVAVSATAAAVAQSGPEEHHMMGGHGGPMGEEFAFLKSAQLTDTQRAQVREVMHTDFAAHKAQLDQLHALHKQIEDALLGETAPNETALLALQKQESSIHAELDAAHIGTAIKIRALLSPVAAASGGNGPSTARGPARARACADGAGSDRAVVDTIRADPHARWGASWHRAKDCAGTRSPSPIPVARCCLRR